MYAKLMDHTFAKQPPVLKQPDETFVGKPITPDAIEVTLVEYDVDTKNAITAHRIKDYRRKRFDFKLLPKIDILFDTILEGSPYWNELLRDESAYS